MNKKMWLAVLLVCMTALPAIAAQKKSTGGGAAGNYTIGMGPIGNFYLTDHHPEMSPGIGAIFYFDYRWAPELSTTTSVMMLMQNGTGSDKGENNIAFLGLPTFDVKYYFVTNPSRWDPYAAVGIGYYAVTAGARGRGFSSGLGAQVGIGFDYYITKRISLGVSDYFRSVAMLGGGSTGLFAQSISGNFGFHF
ncbi:MAG: OmpW family outer membrane protein [Deltaproteobacteria bacterium]|nr:OmpW family outer membrane protein [Deltaproteobacteria bacterium]